MQALIHNLLLWYLNTLDKFGLIGVVVLMAMESSIFPVPSELVVPPAAYLEVYKKSTNPADAVLLAIAVVLVGTLGSYLGSAITYWVARLVGRPFILRYGKYIFIPESKLHLAERWVARYGAGGIFFARLLPVVRHLISIPAGIVGMRFRTFSIMTITGSAVWCTVLTIFGLVMSRDVATILASGRDSESPAYSHAFHNLILATVALVAVMGILYLVIVRRQHKLDAGSPEEATVAEGA